MCRPVAILPVVLLWLMALPGVATAEAFPVPGFPAAFSVRSHAVADSLNVSVRGRWADGGSTSLVVDGGLVYHGRGPLLEIFELDPTEIERMAIGRLEMPSLVMKMALRNGLLYMANYWGGLRIIDVGDPTKPVELGSVAIDGTAWSVDLIGDIAVVPTSGQGVVLVDVSDPAAPEIIHRITGVRAPFAVACVGNLAFLADQTAGFHVYDLSDPLDPLMLWRITGALGADVDVDGEYAYLAVQTGMLIIDISDPHMPTVISSVELPAAFTFALSVAHDVAYAGTMGSGLFLVDVSDPYAPVIKSNAPAGDSSLDVKVTGNLVLVAGEGHGLHLLDVTDTTHPVGLGTRWTADATRSLVVQDSLVAVASAMAGVVLVDVGHAATPRKVGHCSTQAQAWDVALTGAYAVAADDHAGCAVIDLEDPDAPLEVGRYVSESYLQMVGVDVVGDVAYVAHAGDSGLHILDIADPVNPSRLSWLPLPEPARSVAVDGGIACVAAGDLFVVDVADPRLPVLLARVDMPTWAYDVAIEAGFAYVIAADMARGSLQVVDIRVPAAAHEVGRLDMYANSYGVDVSYPFAYVACHDAGLRVVDVTDPSFLIEVGHYVTGYVAGCVHAVGNTVYLGTGEEGFWILHNDLGTTATAFAFQTADRTGTGVRIAWETNVGMRAVIYRVWSRTSSGAQVQVGAMAANDPGRYEIADATAAAGELEYWIELVDTDNGSTWYGPLRVEADATADGVALRSWPNPARYAANFAFSLPTSGFASLAVFDARGRLVSHIHDGVMGAGAHALTWDRRNAAGHPVAAGTYIARLSGRNFVRTVKVVVRE